MNGRKKVIFEWNIHNFIYPFSNLIQSPSFVMCETDWNIRLYSSKDATNLGCSLKRGKNGPPNIEIDFKISLIDSAGTPQEILSIVKRNFLLDECHTSDYSGEFVQKLENLDALTVRCCLWPCKTILNESMRVSARTRIGEERRMDFLWKINNFRILRTIAVKEVPLLLASDEKDTTMVFELISQKNLLGVNLKNGNNIKWLFLMIKMHVLEKTGDKTLLAEETLSIEDLKNEEQYISLEMETSNLTANRFSPKGILTIIGECSFTQILINRITNIRYGLNQHDVDNSSPHSSETSLDVNGEKRIGIALEYLYESKLFHDFILQVDSKEFPVHKNILCAKSSHFRNMFTSGMVEQERPSTHIEDIDCDTMQTLLLYFYTETVDTDLPWESVMKLYSAADKYNLGYLKNKCFDLLRQSLSMKNACQLVAFADLHSDKALKDFVMKFMRDNMITIMNTDEWKELKKRNTELFQEITESKILEGEN